MKPYVNGDEFPQTWFEVLQWCKHIQGQTSEVSWNLQSCGEPSTNREYVTETRPMLIEDLRVVG